MVKDQTIEWLAELGGGKEKVTRGYILNGIAQLMKTQSTSAISLLGKTSLQKCKFA